MSSSRFILRIVLVLLLLGVAGLGVRHWIVSRPDYYYKHAQKSVDVSDYAAARIQLVRLLRSHPEHADGHVLLSRVILAEARAKDQPASYSTQPAAVVHLEHALKLRPLDGDLQRQLLRAYLELRDYGKASPLAEEIYRDDKTNGDAHFALLRRAVNAKDHAAVERLIAESRGIVSRYVFHEFAVQSLYYFDQQDVAKQLAVLDETINMAAGLSADQLRLLARRDREVMLQMLIYAQWHCGSADLSLRISKIVVDLCEVLAKNNLLAPELLAAYSGQSQAAIDVESKTKSLDRRQRALRQQLADRAGELTTQALDGRRGPSPAIVYWTKARELMSKGDYAQAIAAIHGGIDDWSALPPEQRPAGDEDLLQLHLLAARLLMINQQHAEIEPHLAQLSGHKNYEGWVQSLRGQSLLRQGEFAAARDELTRAQSTLGKQFELCTALARVHCELQEWEPAIEQLEALLVPDDQLDEEDKLWRQSFLDYRQCVQFELLRTKLKLNRWQDAQENLRELRETELAPQAWLLTTNYLWQTSERDKARLYLQRAREAFPDDIDLLFLQAKWLMDDGQTDSAGLLFDDLVSASPNDSVRRLAQARWMIFAGKPESALRFLATLDRFPDLTDKERNSVNVFQTQALIEAGQLDEAAAKAELLHEHPATRAAGYLLRALVAWKKGDPTLGADLLAQARSAELPSTGLGGKTMNVVGPKGEVIGVAIHDTYYW